MGNCYVTEVERVDKNYSMRNDRVSLTFYGGAQIVLRTFKTIRGLNKFAETLGFTYKLSVSNLTNNCGLVNTYDISHIIVDPPNYFWSLAELPPEAKKVVLTENGSDVTCYFVNDGTTITIFRPNCNAKDVYRLYS